MLPLSRTQLRTSRVLGNGRSGDHSAHLVFNGSAFWGGDLSAIFTPTYGLLLTAKITLFGAMLILATNNR